MDVPDNCVLSVFWTDILDTIHIFRAFILNRYCFSVTLKNLTMTATNITLTYREDGGTTMERCVEMYDTL